MNYASTDSLCKGDLRGDDDKCKAQETDKSEWDKYVEEYTKELEDFLEDDDIKQSDYFYYGKAATPGSKDVAEQYVEWDKKEYLKGDDADCIKDYFVLSILYSKYLPNKLFGSVGTSDIID